MQLTHLHGTAELEVQEENNVSYVTVNQRSAARLVTTVADFAIRLGSGIHSHDVIASRYARTQPQDVIVAARKISRIIPQVIQVPLDRYIALSNVTCTSRNVTAEDMERMDRDKLNLSDFTHMIVHRDGSHYYLPLGPLPCRLAVRLLDYVSRLTGRPKSLRPRLLARRIWERMPLDERLHYVEDPDQRFLPQGAEALYDPVTRLVEDFCVRLGMVHPRVPGADTFEIAYTQMRAHLFYVRIARQVVQNYPHIKTILPEGVSELALPEFLRGRGER